MWQLTRTPVTCCRVDSFIRSQDPVVCLVGTLAVYSHHRHVELPMPTDSLSSLVQWASQPILQVQQKDETLGVLQSHSCQLVNPFLKAVGVQLTPGFVTRRLRQGGHRQHRREAWRQVSSSGRWDTQPMTRAASSRCVHP